MTIYEKLIDIQTELKAPKGQWNNFGKYHYRSCEDILTAAKPLLKANGLTLMISDDLVNSGNRFYIKAIVKLIDTTNGDVVETTAFAREAETQKGMDLAQITGGASSYARKYALNGLFCIDDAKDSDSTNVDVKEDYKPKSGGYNSNKTKVDAKTAGETLVPFGEHKGKTLAELYKTDKGYFNWLAEKATSNNVKGACQVMIDAVAGRKASKQQPEPAIPTQEQIDAVMDEGVPF